jgi:hypothetical protein
MLAVLWSVATMAQVPLVYDVEHTGAGFPLPAFPTVNELPSIVRLPNPFEFSDGSKFVTSFADWSERRAEIKAEIEHYQIGFKPPRPDDITATYDATGKKLTVVIKHNGKTVTLSSNINVPTGSGPFPVYIGMNSTPSATGIIGLQFAHNDVSVYNQSRPLNGPFEQMYPEYVNNGQYSAWSWGISRLIDGLELVKDEIGADLTRIAVTGCSYAGKMALYGGAFDERIALTIAQESGGGGASSWRITETLGNAEGVSNTNYSWFMQSFKTNFQGKTDRIPYDHHELLAMCAPRALLVLGNDGWDWLGDEGGFTNCMAALEVYKKFGIEDRFGFDFTGGHNHCSAAASQTAAVNAFIDKFLRGNESVNTEIRTVPASGAQYNPPQVDPNPDLKNRYNRWQFWLSEWATDLPARTDIKPEISWMEAESETCATIGSNLVITNDANASGGKYVTVKAGSASATAPGTSGILSFPFTTDYNSEINFYFRMNCEDAEDALWVKIDNGAFLTYDVVGTDGEYKWVKVAAVPLLFGTHKISIGFAKEGIKLDRINITNTSDEPEGMGGTETLCDVVVPKYTIFDFENGNINSWNKWNGQVKSDMDITQESVFCGNYAMMVKSNNPNPSAGAAPWGVQIISPSIPLIEGQKYDVSFWIRVVDGGGKARISTDNQAGLGPSFWPDFNVGEAWELVTFPDMLATKSAGKINFDMSYIKNKTYYIDDIYIDNISVDDPDSKAKNGSFAKMTNWSFQTYDGSAGTWDVDDNKAVLNITKNGPNAYNPQLVQKNIALEKDKRYRLTFTAFAEADRKLQINVEQSASPWGTHLGSIGGAVNFDLTTKIQAFMVEFVMPVTDPSVQLSFNVGQSMEKVTIGNVRLLEVECASGVNAIKEVSAVAASNLRVNAENSAVNVNFTAIGNGATELRLYSVTGVLIESAKMQTVSGENYSHTFKQKNLTSGFYVVSMDSNGNTERAKVVLK